MSRGSFGRTVARAAASGGSKSYRARPPVLWYASIVVIVAVGIFLIVYSRNQAFTRAAASPNAPTATDNWYTALGFDVCGTVEANLPANTNLPAAGIRTFGDGIVNTNPGSVTNSSAFTGAKATLGTFVSTYGNHLSITASELVLPGKTPRRFVTGDRCTTGPDAGKKAAVQVQVWPSTTATGSLYTGDPAAIRLANGQMITVAFVPPGSTIPAPRSKTTLLQDLGKK